MVRIFVIIRGFLIVRGLSVKKDSSRKNKYADEFTYGVGVVLGFADGSGERVTKIFPVRGKFASACSRSSVRGFGRNSRIYGHIRGFTLSRIFRGRSVRGLLYPTLKNCSRTNSRTVNMHFYKNFY